MHPRNIGEKHLDEAKLERFFYSDLLRAAETAKQAKAPPLDWLHILKGKPGVKQVEMDQHFLEEYLEALAATGVRQLDRGQLVQYLKSSPMEMVLSIRSGEELDEDDIYCTLDLGEAHEPKDGDLDPYLDDFSDEALKQIALRDRGDDIYRDPTEISQEEIDEMAKVLARAAWMAKGGIFEDDSCVKCDATLTVRAGDQEFEISGYSDLGETEFTATSASSARSKKLFEMIGHGTHSYETLSSEAAMHAHEILLMEQKAFGRTGHSYFDEYIEPGPKMGYYELLVRAPSLPKQGQNELNSELKRQAEFVDLKLADEKAEIAGLSDENISPKVRKKIQRLEKIREKLSKLRRRSEEINDFYEKSHFGDDANILVHIRVTERVTIDGRRVAFLEELQSDLSKVQGEGDEPEEKQQLRRELEEQMLAFRKDLDAQKNLLQDKLASGYSKKFGASAKIYGNGYIHDIHLEDAIRIVNPTSPDEAESIYNKCTSEIGSHLEYLVGEIEQDAEAKVIAKSIDTLQREIRFTRSKQLGLGTDKSRRPETPITPYTASAVTNLAMKVFLRWAVENEFEEVAWTRPDQQAKRWEDDENIVDYAEWQAGSGETESTDDRIVRFRVGGDPDWIEMVVNPKGTIINCDDFSSRFEGKPLSSFFGTKLTNRILAEADGGYESNPFLMHDDGFHSVYGSQIPSLVKKALKNTDAVMDFDRMCLSEERKTFRCIVEDNIPPNEVVERLIGDQNPDWIESFKLALSAQTDKEIERLNERIGSLQENSAELERFYDEGKFLGGRERYEATMQAYRHNIAGCEKSIKHHRSQEFRDKKTAEYLLGLSQKRPLQDVFPEAIELIPHEVVPHIKLGPQAIERLKAPQSLFRRTEGGKDGISPALVSQALPHLRRRLEEHGVANVDLSFDASMQDDGRVEMGSDNLSIIIGRTLDPEATLDHEAIHILRQRGLFSKREWSALKSAAKDAWMGRFNIAQRYADMPKEVQIEEAIAEAYAQYRALTRKGSDERKAMEKIEAFKKSLILSFVDAGYDSLAAVTKANDAISAFDQVASGGVGSRTSLIEQALGLPPGVLSDREVSVLRQAAERSWIAKYDLDQDAVGLAVEEAYAAHSCSRAPGIIGSIFDKVAEFRQDIDFDAPGMK